MPHQPQHKYGRIQTLLGTTTQNKVVGDFKHGNVIRADGRYEKQVFVTVEVEADEDYTSSIGNILQAEVQSVQIKMTTRHFMGREEITFAVPQDTAEACGFIDSHYGVIEVAHNTVTTNGIGKLTCWFLRPYTCMEDLYKPHRAIMLFACVANVPTILTPLPEDSVYDVIPESME